MDMPHPQRTRLLIWRMLFRILRRAHALLWPQGRFGEDITKLLILTAVTANAFEGKPSGVTCTADFMELPRETTRRVLATLVCEGHLKRDGRVYVPTMRHGSAHVSWMTRVIKACAQEL